MLEGARIADSMGAMSSVAIPEINAEADSRETKPLGPLWMTACFCLVLAAFTALGTLRRITGSEVDYSHHAITYSSQILGAWLMLGAAVSTIYHRRTFFRESLQRHARAWKVEVARGFALYLVVAVCLGLIHALSVGAAGRVLHASDHRLNLRHSAALQLAPSSVSDLLLWVVVSFTAAFCEEVIFRGYLLQQCISAVKKIGVSERTAAVLAVVLTALLFGSMHLYEGTQSALAIVFLGATYAVVALRTGNLRTVIAAHFFQDLVFGLVVYLNHFAGTA
jgi:uncharacterized protein